MTVRTWGQHPVDIGLEFQAAGLSRNARTLYLMLPMTSRILPCGLLEITERRWATECALTLAEVEEALRELATTERASSGTTWLVIDWDTVELLIPTHLRDDGNLRNPKRRKGVETSIDKITSPALRAAALERLHAHPDWTSDDPPPAGPDRANDCPIDQPIHRAMDSPESSIPDPESSSSSSTDGLHTPAPPSDDDDQANQLTTDRARAACELIGARDYERAVTDGVAIRHHPSYLEACKDRALRAWLGDATLTAERWPDLDPAGIADHVDPSHTPGTNPGPDPPAHVPLDEHVVAGHVTEVNGAIVVDLAAARAAAEARP